MQIIYIFDVDGTLTKPRQRMTPEFSDFFEQFCKVNPVYLISGSDLTKLQEQIPSTIFAQVRGTFTCSAAEFWINGEAIYEMRHMFPPSLIEALEVFVDMSSYSKRLGNHIEFRTGMLNVSTVGRNARKADRHAYFEWDKVNQERKAFIEKFQHAFAGYEASAGGEISIDITPRGWNKSRALNVIKRNFPNNPITFYGDRMELNGNDTPLAEALRQDSLLHQVEAVSGFEDTWNHLKTDIETEEANLRQAS